MPAMTYALHKCRACGKLFTAASGPFSTIQAEVLNHAKNQPTEFGVLMHECGNKQRGIADLVGYSHTKK